jgi:hypothetical protein
MLVRLKQQLEESKHATHLLEESLKQKAQDQNDLIANLERQFKFIQQDLQLRLSELESVNITLDNKVNQLQNSSRESEKIFQKTLAEKESIIEEQASKMTYMTNEFETMLNVIIYLYRYLY